MTPAARLQAAIEILDQLRQTGRPADRFVRDWFRARRFAGSKDRAAIAERVYDVLRHRASFAWRMGSKDARALVIASLAAEGADTDRIAALFGAGGYGPPPLSAEERAALERTPGAMPPDAAGEYPAWLEPELVRAFGADLPGEMRAMTMRAPVDLRVNTLKASRPDVIAGLEAAGYDAKPTVYAPQGVRVPAGATRLERTALFEEGAFEFQDEGAQIAALLCDTRPCQNVLDLAAGAGGKTLALAAAMENSGHILAFDDNPARLKPLAARAARAGATIVAIATARVGPAWGNSLFDRVLVDAPCSGTGTWRRQPELRWRLTPERLEALIRTQDTLLDDGARHTAPGGRLVYVTCSVLPCENEDRIEAFLARTPGFCVEPASAVWHGTGAPPPGMGDHFRASPLRTGTDGFFACVLRRE